MKIKFSLFTVIVFFMVFNIKAIHFKNFKGVLIDKKDTVKINSLLAVSKNFADHGYKNILLPIDKSKQSKQKVYQAITLAKIYDCNIHLYRDYETDEQFVMNLRGNIWFVKNKLEEHGFSLASEQYKDSKSKDGFANQAMRYAGKYNIDLLLIIADEGNGVLGGIIGSEDVKIINNDAQILVMCINAINFQILGSIISFIGFS